MKQNANTNKKMYELINSWEQKIKTEKMSFFCILFYFHFHSLIVGLTLGLRWTLSDYSFRFKNICVILNDTAERVAVRELDFT